MAGTLTASARLQALRTILQERYTCAGRPAWISQTELIRRMLRRIGKAGAVHSDVYDLRADRDGALAAAGWWVPLSRQLRPRPGADKVPHYCLARLGEPPPEPPDWMTAARDAVPPAGSVRRLWHRLRGAA